MSDQTPGKPGRRKGSRNKHSTALMRRAMQSSDLTPLEYLLSVMNDEEQDQKVRIDAAKAACPYIHPRLSAVTVENRAWDGDVNSITNEQLASIIAGARKENIH